MDSRDAERQIQLWWCPTSKSTCVCCDVYTALCILCIFFFVYFNFFLLPKPTRSAILFSRWLTNMPVLRLFLVQVRRAKIPPTPPLYVATIAISRCRRSLPLPSDPPSTQWTLIRLPWALLGRLRGLIGVVLTHQQCPLTPVSPIARRHVLLRPDKSSASRSSTSLSSEGSLTETEGSQSPSDPSIIFTEFQTPIKDQGKTTGNVISEDITTQSRGDTLKKWYGNIPPPNTSTIDPSVDQVGHKPEGPDLVQRSLMYRPSSGTDAHPAPFIKTGTGAGTLDDTGADPGKSVFRFDGTPKEHRTSSTGTGTGTKAVSRRQKPAFLTLTGEDSLPNCGQYRYANTKDSLQSPFSPRGKHSTPGYHLNRTLLLPNGPY